MTKYIAEFLGVFALVFLGGGAIIVNSITNGAVGLIGIALAHGIALVFSIYSFASISGAHFNPAVTIAMLINKRINTEDAFGYIVAQLLGGVVAAGILSFLFPAVPATVAYGFPTEVPMIFGIVLEAILTFFLLSTIYGVAINKKATSGVFGFAIGATIIADILMGGTQTGAAMNPARTFGPALLNGFLANQPIYWIGPILGAIIASLIYEKLIEK